MKKLTLLALFCAAMMLPAAAQWTPGDNNLVPIANDTTLEYNRPVVIRKADGSTLLAYRTYGYHINPETGTRQAKRYFYLHFQKLDKDGNKVFGDEGVLISYKRTGAAAYSKLSMDTLSNGNVVLSFADLRMGDTTYISSEDLRAYAYCYTQDGQPVWSTDGVRLPVFPQLDEAVMRRHVQEKVTVSGENIYFTAIAEEELLVPQGDSIVAKYIEYLQVSCLDYEGNILSSRIDSVAHYVSYDVRPAPEGKLYLVYTNIEEGYSVECLDATCQNIWSKPSVIEPYSVVSRSGLGSERSVAPKDMIPMSDGGMAFLYFAYPPNMGTSLLYYNRISTDGSTFPEHVRLTDSIARHHDHIYLIEGENLHVFESRVREITSKRSEFYLYYTRVRLSDGSKLIEEPIGKIWDMHVNASPTFIGLVKANGLFRLITYTIDRHFATFFNDVTTYDPDGKIQFSKPIFGGDQYMSDIEFVNEDNMGYFLLTKGEYGSDGLWMACVDLTDDTNTQLVTAELPGKFSVNAEGKQVQFSQGNMKYMKSHEFPIISDRQWEELDGYNQWIKKADYINWLDLFGWGTGTNEELIKYDTLAPYATFTDWGNLDYRNLSDGAVTWRTMSADEWEYLLNGRENAAQKRAIGGVRWAQQAASAQPGAFLLPDDFVLPDSLKMDVNATSFYKNTYSFGEFYQLQQAGAVFLPLDGYRKDTVVYDYDGNTSSFPTVGHYWTSTPDGELNAKSIKIDKTGVSIESAERCLGMSVRLVKDAEGSEEGIEDVVATEKDKTRKILMDGTLYIIRDGKIYNIIGAKLR